MIVSRGLGRGAVAGAIVAFGLGVDVAAPPVELPAQPPARQIGSGAYFVDALPPHPIRNEAQLRRDDEEILAVIAAFLHRVNDEK